MTVWRRTTLPTGPARGHLVVARSVIHETETSLRCKSWPRRGEERLVLWAGREIDGDILVLSCVRARISTSAGRVTIDEDAVGDAASLARAHRLGIVAQIHTHPGTDTRHSDGDDAMVLMPFEGMFSLVLGRYGRSPMTHGEGLGIHQFQSGRWVNIPPHPSPLVIVAGVVDTASNSRP